MRIRICTITDCQAPYHSHGYCAKHYGRYCRHGNPEYLAASDYDHAVVERAINRAWPGLMTQAERDAVIRRLHRAGLTDRLIADHLDIGTSGVCMARYRLGLHANQPRGHRAGRAA